MALSMTSVRAPVAFRSAALAPRTVVRSSPVVHQRRSLVVRAEVGHCAHHFLLFNDCGLVLLSGATTMVQYVCPRARVGTLIGP
jgi:hypothetical protein